MRLDAFADASTLKHTGEKERFILYVVVGPVARQSEGMIL